MLFLLRTPVFPLVLPIRKVYVRTNPSLIPSDPCWYCPLVLHKVDLRLCKLSETLGGVYSWVFALVWDYAQYRVIFGTGAFALAQWNVCRLSFELMSGSLH